MNKNQTILTYAGLLFHLTSRVFLVPPISTLLDRETKDAIYLASGQGERSMFDYLEAEHDVLFNTVDLLVDKLHELTDEGRLDEARYLADQLTELDTMR